MASSAVVRGNWVAQVRQIFAGLSPTAVTWWTEVERVANAQYQRWLIADPLDRLLLDAATVRAGFDPVRFQRVESRAVSLILAAIRAPVQDEAVSNRWLTTASLLYSILCIYQLGGCSERAMLLSQLVNPEHVKSYAAGVAMLRKWQQHFYRVNALQAALPDSSLLLKGVDGATSALLAPSPLLGLRVNAFRNRVALDHNPTMGTVMQLVKLLQAEFESAASSAAQSVPSVPSPPPPAPPRPQGSKAPPLPPSDAQAKALEGAGDSREKGKAKPGPDDGDANVCYNFSEGKGCRYGDSCRFRHDRAVARRLKRCLACGQEGHFRPDCPLVLPEHRVVQDPSSPVSSGGTPKAPLPKRLAGAKAKATPQAKGIVEEPGMASGNSSTSGEASSGVHEALMAEAAKLLKGVSLKPIRMADEDFSMQVLGSLRIDKGWLISAVTSASDPQYALIDSGATNALRPADSEELKGSRVIRVDLASGAAELHVNRQGTLLSATPCQVILPAGYLVQMVFP